MALCLLYNENSVLTTLILTFYMALFQCTKFITIRQDIYEGLVVMGKNNTDQVAVALSLLV